MTSNNYLIIYDIFDKKRLRKIKKLVYSYSLSGQKSSREVLLDKKDICEISSSILEIIKNTDKINIIKVLGSPILLGKAKCIQYKKGIIIK